MGFYEFNAPEPGDLVYGLADERQKYLVSGALKELGVIDSYAVVRSELEKFDRLPTPAAKKDNLELLDWLEKDKKFRHAGAPATETTLALRRKCKGGIKWAFSRNRTIHFVLDGLDIAGTMTKLTEFDRPSADGTKRRSYTGAELRFIYRNRHDEQFIKGIQFWKEFKQVEPPWVTKPEDFERYQPRSTLHPSHPAGSLKGCCIIS
ncbi:hypothetical protein IV454_19415 [Massilia antarctica]|uniref:Uncharacterized protein n=1 Tax=Massilia antarctica TaxID=2765360 RepID=A0AA48W721_9BURK|nr:MULTISPECIES: hypothetical protein [Massilia]MCY0914264.1 hypothetical protein [Massilia sp. H27-R4]QPI47745.1 hypothetical protein IV454_19415 [Massilia antarctica]CUI08676.1 hypothetical protein BN2497_12129 [Janthinobacterium sp. CG23_2]CUU32462.1 hypothetical protein BN3177_12129 [Janthinobacterium sp. CG23_2]